MAAITHIRSDEARQVHAALVDALGTETNPAQWMQFMRTVRDQLPDVLSRGRPSKAAIQASPIGALGFTTWREMAEAPIDEGGLSLPWSTWRQWSRAWSVIQEHSDLENAPLTAAEVNRLVTEVRSAGEPMPDDIRGIEAFKERQKAKKEADRAETHTALKERLAALETDLRVSREETARQTGHAEQLQARLQYLEEQLAEQGERRQRYQWEMVQLENQVSSLKERNAYLEGEILLHQQGGLLKWLRGLFSSK